VRTRQLFQTVAPALVVAAVPLASACQAAATQRGGLVNAQEGLVSARFANRVVVSSMLNHGPGVTAVPLVVASR
jgi:hypothetical protein